MGWLERSGLFTDVTSNTSLVFDQGMSEIVQANNAFSNGKLVAFFVGANLFASESGGSMFPDHWIMLASPIRIGGSPLPASWPKHYIKMRHPVRTKPAVQNRRVVNPEYRKARDAVLDKRIQFSFFSWGRTRSLPPTTSVESLLDYFYGYVAAR